MLIFRCALMMLALMLAFTSPAHARPDVANTFIEAILTRDTVTLDKILAGNFLLINGNGFLQDKEHFMENLKSGKMTINRMTIADLVTSHYGDATMITGSIILRGTFKPKLPEGLQRATMVLERKGDVEKILLFQMTPVRSKKEKDDAEKKLDKQS